MRTKRYLFIIDPQNDFIEGGSLAVPGGKEALQRIVDSGILDREDWDRIVVSLDSHNPSHLGFGEPKTELRKHLVGREIIKLTQWPPHCVIDTPGWEIYKPLQEKIISLGSRVFFTEKGGSDWDDSYSLRTDDYDIEGIIEEINQTNYQAEIYWTGLAEDYCVLESIKAVQSLITRETGVSHILLSDMTACIKRHIMDKNIQVKPYTEDS